ncbi:EH domain-containing protein 4 [Grus japonensis]|uniref:EH domain-containing protein 4 n=1 Tax=Grus japonensis TaxID=30415 RepID=A0ABC9YD20_GRUJA
MPEQVEAPEGGCGPMGSPRWSKLLAGPVAPWREEPTPETRFAGRTCDLVGDPMLEQSVPEGLHPMEGTHIGEVREGLSPVRGTPCWSRGTMRGVLPLGMRKRQKHHVMN